MRKIVLIILLFLATLPSLAQNASLVAVVSQRFEGGEMIYRRDNGDIYVISNGSGQWWRFSSSEYGRLAENRQTAPSNRISPANGFGRIWANNSTIRTELGWAVNVEIGFEMRFTSSNTGLLYLTRLNGIILELASNQSWQTVNSIPNSSGASIHSFTVSPSSIAKGGTLQIAWEAAGADFVTITFWDTGSPSGQVNDLLEGLALSGSQEWTIPETFTGDVLVTIWLVNNVNSTSPNCCYEWLTSLGRQVDIYQDTSFHLEMYAAYQAYERGFMLWREDTGDVRVFFNTGTWQLFPEHFYAQNSDNNWASP